MARRFIILKTIVLQSHEEVVVNKFSESLQKTVAILRTIYYYWNQAGEATPTKARLTSLKTPEANLPGAPLGSRSGIEGSQPDVIIRSE